MISFDVVHPKDIKKGDILWESNQFVNIQFKVIDNPKLKDGSWSWRGKTSKRGIIDFVWNERYSHYGPKIYSQPVYQGNEEYIGEK